MSLCLNRTIVEIEGKGYLQFTVTDRPVPDEATLRDDQVLVAIEAAPINPSDIGPLFQVSNTGKATPPVPLMHRVAVSCSPPTAASGASTACFRPSTPPPAAW
jgi:hypothetical protein